MQVPQPPTESPGPSRLTLLRVPGPLRERLGVCGPFGISIDSKTLEYGAGTMFN